MTRHVNLYEAKTQLSRLVEEAARGETIIIAKAGKPMARLGPMGRDRPLPRALGQLARRSRNVDWEEWWRHWKDADRGIQADFDAAANRPLPAKPARRKRAG